MGTVKNIIAAFFVALACLAPASIAEAAWVGPKIEASVLKSNPVAVGLFHGRTGAFVTGNFVLPIGAGGFITNGDTAADGTKVIRTDTYGSYVWNATATCDGVTGCWQQLMLTTSIPTADWTGTDYNAGVYEIRIAPSNTSHLYAYFNGFVYSSTNKGVTWTKTAFSQATASANDNTTKGFGPFMAVDPVNENILYAGTPSSGLRYTTDGGTTWTPISTGTIPAALSTGLTQGGGMLIAFDTVSSGCTTPVSSVSQCINVSSYGHGVYRTTNGGQSGGNWTLTSGGTGTPTTHQHMIVDVFGQMWVVDNSGGNLNKYAAGTWSQPAAGSGNVSVAVDPLSASAGAATVVLGSPGGNLNTSTDGGVTWTGRQFTVSTTATDVPWLGWTNNQFMTNGNMAYDLGSPHKLLQFAGIGVWEIVSPNAALAVVWNSQSAGIEQLVANVAVSSPSCSAPVLGFWDRQIYRAANLNSYPSTLAPNNQFAMGWSIDWPSGSNTFVALSNFSGADFSSTSTDCGQTWTPWGTTSTTGIAGQFTSPTNTVSLAGTGNKTFAVAAGLDIQVGQAITAIGFSNVGANLGNNVGTVSSYSGTTLVVAVNSVTGSATPNNWDFEIGSATFTIPGGISISSGQQVYVYETSNPANNFTGTVGTQSGTSLPVTFTGFNNNNGNISDWTVHTAPAGLDQGGCIAALDATHFIMIQGNAGKAFRTADGGLNWPQITGLVANLASGTPSVPDNSWDNNSFLKRYTCAADRVTAGAAYLYNSSTSPNVVGTYKTTDYGQTWSQVHTGTLGTNDGFNAKMQTVPGNAGHLFFTAGSSSAPHPNLNETFKYSTDGGATWNAVGNFNEVLAFGFGSIASGQSYPTIYVVGYNGTTQSTYGIWQCKNFNPSTGSGTWTLVATYPLNTFDALVAIDGDKTVAGKFYLGFAGSGYQWGQTNWLLKRDIDPASNDNDPMWLEKAA